jgi:predicted dehydrogenase
MPAEIGVGLVSVGWMGTLHSRSYLAVPVIYPELGLRPRLVNAADTDPGRSGYARDVLGYARSGDDYRAVLADPDVDVVSICAPNALHAEIGVAAAEARKPFWIEKPVGRDVSETASVVAAAKGLPNAVGYNYRHVPAVARIRELVASGQLGRITNVRGVFFNGYASAPEAALSWRFRRAQAGTGALGDLLSHVVDLVHFLVGPITDVSALASTVHSRRPVPPPGAGSHFAAGSGELHEVENEDYAAALVRFAGGAVGTLETSRVIVGPDCGLGVEIYGTEGSASWNFERMNELRVRLRAGEGYTTVLGNPSLGEYGRFQPGPGQTMGYDDLKVIEAKNFLSSVAGVSTTNATVDDALAASAVLAAMVSSAADGFWHSVPHPLEAPDA